MIGTSGVDPTLLASRGCDCAHALFVTNEQINVKIMAAGKASFSIET
jgi:hypothetical protein